MSDNPIIVQSPAAAVVRVEVIGATTVQVLDQAESPVVVQSPAAALIEVQTAAPSTVDVASVGARGLSAYQVAVANGFSGTEADWLESLEGPQGDTGLAGADSTVAGPQGEGVPVGGATGQVMAKVSAADFDTEWVDAATGGASVTVDTRAAILALAADDGDLAYASDTQEAFIYQGGWKQSSTLHDTRQGSIDMGVAQDSNLAGYGPDYVTDKTLSNVAVGSNADPREGAVRRVFSSSLGRNLFQTYLQGGWQTILTGVNIQTDKDEEVPDIEFTDFAPWVLSLITGNSDRKALDGTPLVKEMKIDMGAYSADLVIDGGSF